MFYHLSLQISPDTAEAFRRGLERERELRRAARRARAEANAALGRALVRGLASALVRVVGRFLRGQIEAAARRRLEARTVRELQEMSDVGLADIGLRRADIRGIARTLAARQRAGAASEIAAVPQVERQVEPEWRPQWRSEPRLVPTRTKSLGGRGARATAGPLVVVAACGDLRDCA